MTQKLILVRHGRTGLSGRYVGALDVELSAEGVLQMEKLKHIIDKQTFGKILSSPMTRCRQSSDILFPGQPVSYEKELREVNFGRWENLTFQEIVEKDPDLVDSWSKHPLDFCFPAGECVKAFIGRIQQAGESIRRSPESDIILISHGGVIRNLLCYFLNLDYSNALLFQVQKGCFSTLDLFDKGAVLKGFNIGTELK